MPNVPLQIPAGMSINSTEYDSKGRWVNGNWVRFWRGKPRPIGGWVSATANVPLEILGVCRVMHAWRDLTERKWLSLGTNSNLYVYDGADFFDITPVDLLEGPVSGGAAEGYGGGDFGVLEYGTPREFAFRVQAPANWTMDNWGEDLIAVANWEGIIYSWTPTKASTPAAPLADPTANTEVPQLVAGILVSNERHLVAIGAGKYDGANWVADGRRIAWSDQENNLVWNPTVTNAAGDLQLQSKSLAVCGTKFKNEILIWTSNDVHRMSYLGPPYYYGITRLAEDAGIVGSSAYCVTNRFVCWVARDSIMIYDGSVKELSPEVTEWYASKVNPNALGKTVVGHNPAFNEVWIFITAIESEENSDYIIWNYEENTWSVGQLPRSAWNPASVFKAPYATKPSQGKALVSATLYQHETGWTDDGNPRLTNVWLESSPIEIAQGDNLAVVRRFVQDTLSDATPEPSTALQVSFRHRLSPEGDELIEGPYQVDTTRGYTDVRFTGRQVKVRFESIKDTKWLIGSYRLEMVPGSGR